MMTFYKVLFKYAGKIARYAEKRIDKRNISTQTDGVVFELIKSKNVGRSVYCVKPFSFEGVRPYDIYGIIKNIHFNAVYPDINIMEYRQVTCFTDSDFLLIDNKAVWDKSNYPMFPKMYPKDVDLIDFSDSEIIIKSFKVDFKVKTAISMCGVHARVWSHFLVQYLPKIYYYQQYLENSDEKISIILPNYDDLHVSEAVNMFLEKFKNFEVIILNSNQSVECEKLFYIESMSMISDHEYYQTYTDFIVPECVRDFLKQIFVPACFERFGIHNQSKKNKLYVVRKDAEYRNLMNSHEVEEFFESEGFLFIEPHKLSFKEKIELFYNASIVAGPYSAGFSNILYCQKSTRILLLSNIQRSFETYLNNFVDMNEVKFIAITGRDRENNSQSSYTVPLSRIKEAYSFINSEF